MASISPCVHVNANISRGATHLRRLSRRSNYGALTRTRYSVSASLPLERTANQRRRSVSAAILLLHCFSYPNYAVAGSPFDKYVKRKKLEPLETYVPAVLLSQLQFQDLENSLEVEVPQYDVCRSLLRSGPAASLRLNIRAVAQYASDDGKGKVASDAVDQCLSALEDLDSQLLRALRKDPNASVKSMKAKMDVALGALDSLLQTVPPTVLEKGRVIADIYRTPTTPEVESRPEELDPDLKQLDAIL
ncbi:hypothetical protein QJS10_CPA09g00119 [Acorus calamus]|uniref:DUF7880 domain-containing protein n=1 Tax=Acorus calamus TaxID=4465 RepID=A0AAV9E622_ACOCL|nr:hypothetical protein QJS10_CPA09g00119 [Acorus calamus]